MKKQFFYLLALVAVIGLGCQKELSFEIGDSPAAGSLQSDVSGDCLPKTVNGFYVATTPLVPTTNTITVTVDVTTTGSYVITTDTVNGYYFRAVGLFTTLGANVVTLRGNGTPFADGVNNFVVSFDGSVCDIQVTVLPAGSGPATFTLAGSPSCTTPVINGAYAQGVPLTAANTVVLNVNVTVAGSYNVTIPATNGMSFAGTGTLATGAQTITLTGTGTPTTIGPNVIPITVGSSSCSFTITVIAPITGTLGGSPGACTPVTVNGTYFNGFALNGTNSIQIEITTTVGGPYSITASSASTPGFSFAGTGTVPGAGTHNVTLNGTGTPTSTGVKSFTVTFGTSTCTFDVTVSPGASFVADCASAIVNGTYQVGVGLNSAVHTVDIDVDVTAIGPYNFTTTATNGMSFTSSGVFTTLGVQNITLTGSGTPGSAGVTNIPMAGTTPCTFPVTVAAAPVISWKFNIGTTVYQGSTFDVTFDNTTAPPFTLLDYLGDNAAGDEINFTFADLAGGITATETYNSPSIGLTNLASFYFTDGAGTLDLTAEPGVPPVGNMVFTVTSHNTATKTIIGTFSGTAFDAISSTTKTITSGTFTVVYP